MRTAKDSAIQVCQVFNQDTIAITGKTFLENTLKHTEYSIHCTSKSSSTSSICSEDS